jgi:hypothetical protein
MTPTVAAKKPAVGAAAKVLPYTGREYLDSLDDGRESGSTANASPRSPSIRRFRTAHA